LTNVSMQNENGIERVRAC